MAGAIFTIGYEDRDISEFLGRIKKHEITTVIDVREIPSSRKKGFSKKAIQSSLESLGVKYVHIKALGSPKHLRDKLHSDNDYDAFFQSYEEYLGSQEDVLFELYENTVLTEVSCLMCMERHSYHCHRRVVAERIKKINGNGLVINHI